MAYMTASQCLNGYAEGPKTPFRSVAHLWLTGPVQHPRLWRLAVASDCLWGVRRRVPGLHAPCQRSQAFSEGNNAVGCPRYDGPTPPRLPSPSLLTNATAQLIRAHHASYPDHSSLLASIPGSHATSAARLAALRAIPAVELLAAHNAAHKFGGLSLTLEEGPHATWSENTMTKLGRGEWDEWIESVIIGTNEHEGSMFAAMGMQASLFLQPFNVPSHHVLS